MRLHCHRISTSEANRSGRPIEVATAETNEKFHNMMFTDRRLKLCEIMKAISTWLGSVISNPNDH